MVRLLGQGKSLPEDMRLVSDRWPSGPGLPPPQLTAFPR